MGWFVAIVIVAFVGYVAYRVYKSDPNAAQEVESAFGKTGPKK
jgi:predicted negative regulator of RcsB-dependent stress response